MNKRIKVQSIRDQAYEQMREMILDGQWEPGTRIDLNKLVDEFGVSKTPLNEAIQKLLQEGLLFVKPRSGTFVSDLNMEEIAMTFDFRLALEIGAARAIIENMTDKVLVQLESIDKNMASLLQTGEKSHRKKFLHLDAEFHDTIIACAKNSLIVDHYRQVNSLSNVSRARGKFNREEYEATLQDHETIIAALRARDVESFCAASRDHITKAKIKLKEALRRSDAA